MTTYRIRIKHAGAVVHESYMFPKHDEVVDITKVLKHLASDPPSPYFAVEVTDVNAKDINDPDRYENHQYFPQFVLTPTGK